MARTLFNVDDTATGNGYANIFRFLTIAVVITLTVIKAKRMHGGLQVNRKTLWRKR
ncbi:hypothetical protein [Sphingobacterium sp.]|uniref:hypothetical protein n=1 Tax=Sphingobacterium sp. TaxID=341027 RepID=UPI0031E16746